MKINLKDKSLVVLIAVNLFPIIGVLFLDWSYISVIFLYIIETFIIGLFNVVKIIMAQKGVEKVDSNTFNITDSNLSKDKESYPGCLKFVLVPFFLVHYNFFILVQAIFIYFIAKQFGEQDIEFKDFLNPDYVLNVLFIILSHAYSFYKNYIKKEEFKKASAPKLMFLPYKRIIIQQVTVLAGSFIIFFFKTPVVFMLVLIALKIFFDVKSHYKIHDAFSKLEYK